jgi:hypothetical protein
MPPSIMAYDPVALLQGMRRVERMLRDVVIDERVARLRTNGLRSERETRIACIFAVGLSVALGRQFWVAPGEDGDHDFLIVAPEIQEVSGAVVPVQLKELVPADLNSDQTLADLKARVAHCPRSSTVLLIHLNRRGTISFDDLQTFASPFSENWFLWCSDREQTRWAIFGMRNGEPVHTEFEYPEEN